MRERAVASFDLVLLQVAERARIIDDEDGRGLLAEAEWKANLVDMATGLLTAPASRPSPRRLAPPLIASRRASTFRMSWSSVNTYGRPRADRRRPR